MSIYDEKTLSVEDVVRLISRRTCLICFCNLDKDLGREDWHIPLCEAHRNEFLEDEE